jgi:hypothetical protein
VIVMGDFNFANPIGKVQALDLVFSPTDPQSGKLSRHGLL